MKYSTKKLKYILELTKYLFVFVIIALTGCISGYDMPVPTPVPVLDGVANQAQNSALRDYQVQKGDTLYSIAWRFALDYNELARINHLVEPYTLHVGQQLQLKSSGDNRPSAYKPPRKSPKPTITRQQSVKTSPKQVVQQPVAKPSTKPITIKKAATRYAGGLYWRWPAQGIVVKGYSPKGNASNKGIDIAGRRGQSVMAAADGKVVYRGSGLRGYGRLIIIKHNAAYLSAYAHNDKLLVKEGQVVKAGQKIAEMGNSDARRIQLHFEIRKKGKPVNPLRYLPKA